jgi:stress-induced-phosphoprotein 1
LEFYSKAIEADEKNHVLYSNRSATYAALKNYPKALEDSETVIKLNGTWPKGHFRKGAALEALLRYPEAYQAYQAGLAIEANDAGLQKAATELKSVMDELKMGAAATATDSKENPDVDKFDAMCNWLREGGGLV